MADSVVVRDEPGRQSERVTQICFDTPYPCPPLLLGPDTGYESVYIVDGPVAADGYEWYLAATDARHAQGPEYVGWIAVGDEAGPWVVPADTECPADPIELGDVTYSAISRLELLACIGGRELTLRGWHPAAPTPESSSAMCQPIEEREFFCSFGYNLLRPVEAGWAGDGNALDWIAETGANVAAPPRDTWITVQGQFDHPASTRCHGGDPHSVLFCRMDFVVHSVSVE